MGDWRETYSALERADVGIVASIVGAVMLIIAVLIAVVMDGSAAPPWAVYTVAILAPLGIAAMVCGVVIVFAAAIKA